MTLVGDVAQSTTPAGQERWSAVFDHLSVRERPVGAIADLTIGYRVPEPILTVANRLLAHTGVDATESRSVRRTGAPPTWHVVPRARVSGNHDLVEKVAEVAAATKRRRRVSGVVAPAALHVAIGEALAGHGLVAVDHVHELGPAELPLFDPERVKGLEFDGVIVVNPHEILSEGTAVEITPRGARLLYVAMTRAVQELHLVTDSEPPAVLAPEGFVATKRFV
jgi:DNA helicase IV